MSGAYVEWLAFLRAIDLPWCVVATHPGREKAVQAELALAGWSTYLPTQTVWAKPTRLKRRISRPVFARYLFAACNPGGDEAASHRRGIDGQATIYRPSDAEPRAPRRYRSAVKLDLLARLMLTELRHGFDLTYEKPRAAKRGLVCGQEVTVRAGTLKGVEALIVKVLSEREVLAKTPVEICGKDEFLFSAANLDVIVRDTPDGDALQAA